ncbi:MAG: zinc ribbon domain-containing protein [Solobacterium sp.]|uniref:zinc-ribbon domain-containing protein n=1 Tax=Solobacterium sp. TaxID=2060878 RepID=UPI001CAAFFE4|nr:zinc-ribbon domain-containing protein [Solobacterium sp.]MBF1089047.1 zinc ribbon domain-containing protein [Solobacterium sp.]
MICKNCGKEISDKSKFCGYCGAKVVEQTVQSQPEAVKESMFSRFCFNRSDLITLWKTAENPFQGSDLSFSASVVIVVLNLIANVLILRCIICGIGLTIFFLGSIYTYCYLNRKEGQKPENVYCDVARIIFVPTVFILLAGIFIFFQTLEALWVWSMLLSMSFCMGSLFATVKRGNKFLMIALITFIYAVILTILVSQHTLGKFFGLVSLLGFRTMW